MRTLLFVALGLLLNSNHLFGQNDNVTLLAQSNDGKTVKLFWFIKHWDKSYTGFDLRRKDGTQNWVKLNQEPIQPGLWSKRKLSTSGCNKYDESLLKPKLYRLFSSHKQVDTDPARYLQKLNTDENELRKITAEMTEDYELAILNGFGYIDHSLSLKSAYQYGLFLQGTEIMLAKTSWNFGAIPDLDVVQELTSKVSADNKGIKVIWVADTDKIKTAHVAGFNIYREGIRLNSNRILPEDSKDPSVYTWYDKSVNSTSPIQYSVAAESVFDIEGIIRSYAYDPIDHPKEYKKADVTNIASLGFYFKEGTSVKWSFPKDQEKFIKGYYIEKDNMPAGYTQVSGLIDPSARSFTDNSHSQVNGYIRVRVKTLYKDRVSTTSSDHLFSYFPVNEPPQPQNLKVKSVSGDRRITAYLSWDPPMAGDSMTSYYKLYAYDQQNNKFMSATDQPIMSNSFTYVIDRGLAGLRKFCVSSVNKQKTESVFSDTVSVQTPSMELPSPVIKKVAADNYNKATIEWQFPDIPDLKGFRLTQNGKVIATEIELKKEVRQFVTEKLEEGMSYEFSLIAVSDIGVLSNSSAPFHVVVTETSKK